MATTTTAATPTPDQVASVQASLGNIGDLLRDTHNFSTGTLATLFQLEEQTDIPNQNVWELAGSALFLGVVGCVPYVGPLIAGIAASTFVLAQQQTAPTPTDFTGALAEVSNWLDTSFEGAITTLDDYAADVAGNWGKTIAAPGYPDATLAQLASFPAPARGTKEYDIVWQAAMVSVKRAMWQRTLDELFTIVEYGGLFTGVLVEGTSAANTLSKLSSDQLQDLTSYYPVYGEGTSYEAKQKQIAYNRTGDIKSISPGAASWIFTDNAAGDPRPANELDTAFCTHAEVFGTFDLLSGAWQGGGWITNHLSFP